MADNACTLYDASSPPLSEHFASPPAFTQTGSWSWVNLIDSGIRGAISVLARYSAGGVDQYTVIVGQLMCTKFRLNQNGERRLRDAIEGLTSVGSLGAALHFGFGINSITRNLASTIEGGILIGLCSALIEAYEHDHASNIMWELVRAFKPQEDRTPSPMQWKALLNACAGTLSRTDFPALAENFMRMHSIADRLSVGRSTRDIAPSLRGVSSPDSVANALAAIGQVSRNELRNITVVGGADAGWLAAIAEWLFDLRVTIIDTQGRHIYASQSDQHTQVTVRFNDATSQRPQLALAVLDRVCYLRDVTELFHFDQNDFGPALVSSRVPWQSALSMTFGGEFKQLIKAQRSFAKLLSAAGSIFDDMSRAELAYDDKELLYCQTYLDNARGRGFTSFALLLFPELQPLRHSLDDMYHTKSSDPLTQYDGEMAILRESCRCSVCLQGATEGAFEERFCLVLLVETIILIVHCMAGVSAHNDLMPMRSGLEAQYRRQMKLHASEILVPRLLRYGMAGAIMEFNPAEVDESLIEESVAIPRMIHALRLYTGRDIRSSDHAQAAIYSSGMVAYLDCIVDRPLSLNRQELGRCTVIPGHIEIHGRLYNHLEDFSDFDLDGMDYRLQQSGTPIGQLDNFWLLRNDYHQKKLAVREGTTSARVGISISPGQADLITATVADGPVQESESDSYMIGPATSTALALKAIGLVRCRTSGCEHRKARLDAPHKGHCSQLVHESSSNKIWCFTGNDLSQYIALNRVRDMLSLPYCLIRHDQCLKCCITQAQLSMHKTVVVLTDKH